MNASTAGKRIVDRPETVASVRVVAPGSNRVATLAPVVSPFRRKVRSSRQKDLRTLRQRQV